jgi:hypothetical protein
LWCKDAFNASVGGLNLSSSGAISRVSVGKGGFLSLFHQRSGLCRSVVNLDLQHWIVGQQFFGCLFGGTFVRKLGFEMPIDDYRVSNSGDDVSPLNISGLLFFDAESWLFSCQLFLRHLVRVR